MDQARHKQIVSGSDRSAGGALWRAALAGMEPGYRLAVQLRNRAYDQRWRVVQSLGRPTVSIGNLTAGGTGKTPMVIETLGRLMRRGLRPAILLRGYGDDEIHELERAARRLAAQHDTGGWLAPVQANPDRVQGAQRVLARHPQVSTFILDDGFQHRRVSRDLDLVLIDATQPFGYEHVLPRGLLREPMENLRRADGIIVTRSDQLHPQTRRELDERIVQVSGQTVLAHTASSWCGLRDARDRQLPMTELAGQRIVGVCGVGNPEAFKRMLKDAGAEVVRFMTFDDHHAYQADELRELILAARKRDRARAVVTTEKDWVKWRRVADRAVLKKLPIWRPMLRMRFVEGEHAFDLMLERVATIQP